MSMNENVIGIAEGRVSHHPIAIPIPRTLIPRVEMGVSNQFLVYVVGEDLESSLGEELGNMARPHARFIN